MREDVTVTGGVGGTRARLDDLERCATVMVALCADLEMLRGPLRRLGRVVEDAARVSPGTAPAAARAVEQLSSPTHGVPAAAARARDTAERLRRVARGYADADAAVVALLQRWAVTAAHTLGEAGPAAWLGTGAAAAPALVLGGAFAARLVGLRMLARTPTGPGMALGGLVDASEQRDGALGRWLGGPGLLPRPHRPTTATLDPVVAVVAAFVVGAAPGRRPVAGGLVPWWAGDEHGPPGVRPTSTREAARVLTLPSHVAAHGIHGPTALVVAPQPVVRAAGGRERAPRDTADLVAGIGDVHPAGSAPPGTVAVQRLEDPSGSASWVVTIPGTQSGSLTGGPLPADMTSNLALAAGRTDDVSALAREAMERAGIPPHEPVQIVGHSQGGLAAVAVANHPDVRSGYDVRTVVTAGSPVAAATLPDGVLGLHLEHARDGVLAADGLRPPDRVNQTFVEVDLLRSTDPAQRAAGLSWSGAHEVGTYARTAGSLAGVPNASVAHATQTVEELLGGPGTTVTTQWFTGTRLQVGRDGG